MFVRKFLIRLIGRYSCFFFITLLNILIQCISLDFKKSTLNIGKMSSLCAKHLMFVINHKKYLKFLNQRTGWLQRQKSKENSLIVLNKNLLCIMCYEFWCWLFRVPGKLQYTNKRNIIIIKHKTRSENRGV